MLLVTGIGVSVLVTAVAGLVAFCRSVAVLFRSAEQRRRRTEKLQLRSRIVAVEELGTPYTLSWLPEDGSILCLERG